MKFRIRMFQQYRGLIEELVARDLKLKYRRSFLGYVWSILNPLLVMIVMTIVFSAMFKRNIENYPVYLLTGRMTFDFFTTSTNAAMNSVTGNAAMRPVIGSIVQAEAVDAAGRNARRTCASPGLTMK